MNAIWPADIECKHEWQNIYSDGSGTTQPRVVGAFCTKCGERILVK